jgi:putative ABC transport system ATP-binding protein
MEDIIIKTECLTKKYQLGKMEIPVLKGIDLTVKKGEFMIVAGPSGSGKTTLFNLIGGLDRPTSGKIWVSSQELSQLNFQQLAEFRKSKVSFVFQFFNLVPVLTVYENIEFPLLLQQITSCEIENRILRTLEKLGLKNFKDRYPNELSGGQQQRVAIARALATNPAIILADEPTANLDSLTGETIINLMLEINQKENVSFLIATHDPMVTKHASHLVEIHDGLIVNEKNKNIA